LALLIFAFSGGFSAFAEFVLRNALQLLENDDDALLAEVRSKLQNFPINSLARIMPLIGENKPF
jgi:hypothetical protein